MSGVCGWPVDTMCLPAPGDDTETLDSAVTLATNILWALSGRRYGICPATTRPCPTGTCMCGGGCREHGPRVVTLPGPVDEVTAVHIGDTTLDTTSYSHEGDRLYRHDGVWPRQDLTRPTGEPGTWWVEYERGVPVPDGVGRLVGLLAAEFYAACTGGKCRLPRRVETVQRQGVTMRMVDPADIYRDGKTGLPEVDMWLAAVNPNHVAEGPVVR